MDWQARLRLKLQVLSYRGQVTLQCGELPLFSIFRGRCDVCSCSAFRHHLTQYLARCKSNCPNNTLRAHNSTDLVSLSMPQLCDPSLSKAGRMEGPVRLEIRGGTLDTVIGMEAPVVSYPRLEGAVTKSAKQILYEMQDRRCNACFDYKTLDQLTYDHRVPKSKYGPKDIVNAELM